MLTYSNPRTSLVIENWPWNAKTKTRARFWIEMDKRGERAVRVMTSPTTGGECAPKKTTYCRKAVFVDGSDGKLYLLELTQYGFFTVVQGNLQFNEESVHPEDPRHADLLALIHNF